MKKILLIEDNRDIRENLMEYLQLCGFEILTANCGVTGVQMAREFNPDLIICDIIMPDLNGYEVLKELSGTARTPFIFSTSKSEKLDIMEGMRLGAHDFIIKPYTMENLLVKIHSVMQWTSTSS